MITFVDGGKVILRAGGGETFGEYETRREAPVKENHTAAPGTVWDLVISDMHGRDALGLRKYGRALLPHDGRDTLQDAYEEALDLAVYLRKAMLERDGK